MFTELAFESDPGGLHRFRYISGVMPYRSAAERILTSPGTVFLLTGFYVLRARTLETDGITGSWVLLHVLRSLGRHVVIPADSNVLNMFQNVYPDIHVQEYPYATTSIARKTANDMLTAFQPETLIAVERPGPLKDGSYRNFNGDNITSLCAPMDFFWSDGPVKIAIGDRGNELGMGALTDVMSDNKYLCPLRADFTLTGSTSDFAAWCLAAAIETVAEKPLMPSPNTVKQFLKRLPELGFVDGITTQRTATVDGLEFKTVMNRYDQIYSASRMLAKTQSVIHNSIRSFGITHNVPVVSVNPRLSRDGSNMVLDGFVLLQSQLNTIKNNMARAGMPVHSWPSVLSAPESSGGEWLYVPEMTFDLFDHPDGRLTTQIADYDQWIRRLYTFNNWSLYQTPDGALGWSSSQNLVNLPALTLDKTPWNQISRPGKGECFLPKHLFTRCIAAAETLRDVPYLWGGRNIDGLDCSGMTQRVFQTACILLPRNSREQRRCGKRVPMNQTEPLDLLFATSKSNGFHHAALVLPDGIQHACLGKKRVIVEPLRQFCERYTLIGARRISSFA